MWSDYSPNRCHLQPLEERCDPYRRKDTSLQVPHIHSNTESNHLDWLQSGDNGDQSSVSDSEIELIFLPFLLSKLPWLSPPCWNATKFITLWVANCLQQWLGGLYQISVHCSFEFICRHFSSSVADPFFGEHLISCTKFNVLGLFFTYFLAVEDWCTLLK